MNRKPDHHIAYTLDGDQPVACTYVADQPYFYSSMSDEERAREAMWEVRDALVECRDILLGAACCSA